MGGIRLAGVLNALFENAPVNVADTTIPSAKNDVNQIKPIAVSLADLSKQLNEFVSVSGVVYDYKDMGSMILINIGAAILINCLP